MSVASRTPEGFPSSCPLCGASINLEYSIESGDAPCPQCGHLLWQTQQIYSRIQQTLSRVLGVPADQIHPLAALAELSSDSLDVVELVMELEEEFDLSIDEADAQSIRTVRDALRLLLARHTRIRSDS